MAFRHDKRYHLHQFFVLVIFSSTQEKSVKNSFESSVSATVIILSMFEKYKLLFYAFHSRYCSDPWGLAEIQKSENFRNMRKTNVLILQKQTIMLFITTWETLSFSQEISWGCYEISVFRLIFNHVRKLFSRFPFSSSRFKKIKWTKCLKYAFHFFYFKISENVSFDKIRLRET